MRDSPLPVRTECGIPAVDPIQRTPYSLAPGRKSALTGRQPNRRNICTESQGAPGERVFYLMTTLRFSALAACLLASIALARAETRIFILDSSDGYGIDNCLAKGEACGKAMATALCKSNRYAAAVDYGRMDPTEITGAVPAGVKVKVCEGAGCPEKVAITCTR